MPNQEPVLEEELALKRQELEKKRALRARKRRQRRLFYLFLVVLALLLAGITAYYTMQRNFALPTTVGSLHRGEDPTGETPLLGRFDVVVLGADEKPDDPGRADTIMVASIDFDHRRLSVISVPRDTMVTIPGRPGRQRINAAYAYGGPELTVKTLSQLFNIPLQYYVRIDFQGFIDIVDILGGVTVDIQRPMYYEDQAQGLIIDLKPGLQRLTGEQALGYVRFRHDGLGDVALVDPNRNVYDGRINRQQKFIKAFLDELLHIRTVTKIPALVHSVIGAVETNIPYFQAMRLAMLASRIEDGTFRSSVVPGTSALVEGASYWVADTDRLELMVKRMILGEDQITVEVLNGSGIRGAARQVAEGLTQRGYAVLGVTDADTYDYEKTQIFARPTHDSAAKSLGEVLNTGSITLTNDIRGNDIDMVVIVGKDYRIE